MVSHTENSKTEVFIFNEKNKKLENILLQYPTQETIKTYLNSVLNGENCDNINLFDYIQTDLFGNIRLISFEEKYKGYFQSQRQISLLNIYLDDLLKQVKKDTSCSLNTLKILLIYVLSKNKHSEVEEILINTLNSENYMEEEDILAVCEIFNIYQLDEQELEKVTQIWLLLIHYKRANIVDMEKEQILNLVLEKKYLNLLGLCFFLYQLESRHHNELLLKLDDLIYKNIKKLKKDEQDTFWNHYKKYHSIVKSFFLMKKIFPKSVIKSVIEDEKKKYGKNELIESLNYSEKKIDRLLIQQKYENLKKQKLTYILNPFELLIVLSAFYNELKDDIKHAQKTIPNSYLVRRAVSILYFYQGKYKYFLKEIEYTGRFQHSPEIIYLKAVSLLEIGEIDKGGKILKFLQNQFSDSKYLEVALKKYQS